MIRPVVLTVAVSMLVAGCAAPTNNLPPGLGVQEVVETALLAGFVDNSYEGYIAAWQPEGRIIFGRSESPDAHDITYHFAQFSRAKKLRMAGPVRPGMQLKFDNSVVNHHGWKATLRHRATVTVPGNGKVPAWREVVDEEYRLRMTAAGWRIIENRWWPVQLGPDAFDAAAWRRLDAEVSRHRTAGDLGRLAAALMTSFRFPEALQVARQWCGREPSTTDAWLTRGYAASLCGAVDEAVRAFQQAKEVDPGAALPTFIAGRAPGS